ncbi:MAG: hypothetical protein V4642_05710 [Bacteroidota bacterium]
MNRNTALILLLILILVGFTIVLWYLDPVDRTKINILAIIGTLISIYGLALAYLQIHSLRETAEKTEKAVNAANERINQILSVSELSKTIQSVREVQNYIKSEKYELAQLRMKDVKSVLIQVKHNIELFELTNSDEYKTAFSDFIIDLNNLSSHVLTDKRGVNFKKIIANLESISSLLSEFENKLKYKRL